MLKSNAIVNSYDRTVPHHLVSQVKLSVLCRKAMNEVDKNGSKLRENVSKLLKIGNDGHEVVAEETLMKDTHRVDDAKLLLAEVALSSHLVK